MKPTIFAALAVALAAAPASAETNSMRAGNVCVAEGDKRCTDNPAKGNVLDFPESKTPSLPKQSAQDLGASVNQAKKRAGELAERGIKRKKFTIPTKNKGSTISDFEIRNVEFQIVTSAMGNIDVQVINKSNKNIKWTVYDLVSVDIEFGGTLKPQKKKNIRWKDAKPGNKAEAMVNFLD